MLARGTSPSAARRAAAPGRLHLQNLSTLLLGPLLGVELGFKLLDLGIDPGPPLPELSRFA
jgi:hypothetical protein